MCCVHLDTYLYNILNAVNKFMEDLLVSLAYHNMY